jgi:4-amino-4-deoxy-L-arabinose transferase-like glycosyltransferase
MIGKFKPWHAKLFLVFLMGLVFLFLGLGEFLFTHPFGIHFIRQTDSLSFVAQYFNNGFDFFDTRIFNLESTDGKAVCEFPLIYYFTSLLYAVFGEKMYLLKFINLIITYIGIIYVYKLSFFLLKDFVYALLISLFLFTSTVFNYYSFNYLPDTAALGLALMGWYYYFKYARNHNKTTLFLMVLFFTLGGLLKVTYSINMLAILCYLLFAQIRKKEHFDKSFLLSTSIGLLLIILWNIYVIYYNASYHSNYFTTSSRPLWSLSANGIQTVWDYINNYWYSKYFAHSSFHVILAALLLQLVFVKKSAYRAIFTILILIMGSLAYFILFFAQFKDHDYYFIAFLPLVILILINGIFIVQKLFKKQWIHLIFKLVIAIVVVSGINYSKNKLQGSYFIETDSFSETALKINKALPEIRSLNIPGDAKLIIAPDGSKNGGLLFMNRTGWPIDNEKNITLNSIENFEKLGADFLILATEKEALLDIGKKSGSLIYSGDELSIFKLNK